MPHENNTAAVAQGRNQGCASQRLCLRRSGDQYPNENDDPPQPPRTKASRTEVTRRLITPNRVEVRRTSKVVRWFLHDNSPVEQNVDVPSVTVVAVLGVDK